MNANGQSDPPAVIIRENWADLIAVERIEAVAATRHNGFRPGLARLGWFLAPVVVAWLAASFWPQAYVSQTSFILRDAPLRPALPDSTSDISAAPSEAGNADSYAVQSFLRSRDAMKAAGFGEPGQEARFAEYRDRVSVDYETSSGVITVTARGSGAIAAHDLALRLRDAAAGLVKEFGAVSKNGEYMAVISDANTPDAPARPSLLWWLLGGAGLGLLLSWVRKG